MSEQIDELKKIFEYEIKRKLSERARSSADEFRILMSGFKFYDYTNSGKVNQTEFVKGILRTGLSGFNESDIRSIFNNYDMNNSGYIDYKNFCNYLYGREPLAPLSNSEKETQNTSINNDKNNNNEQIVQKIKTPININQNQRQKTPLNNNENQNLINNNIQNLQEQHNQNIAINSENNQQNIDPNQTKEYFKKLIMSIKEQIHTNNGLTYYSFLFELKNNSDQDQNISLDNFVKIFKNIGLNIPQNDIINFFNLLDFSGTGKVTFDDIINTIVDPMNEHRKLYVVNKFAKLDVEKQGEVKVSLLKEKYNPKGHPNVISGKETDEEIFKQFCYTLDIYCNIRNITEIINYKQFVDYYNGISSSIIDDTYFEDILNGVWDIGNNNDNINNNINNNNLGNNLPPEQIQINQNMNQMGQNRIINNNLENQNINNRRYNNDQNNRIIKQKNILDSGFDEEKLGINSIFLGESTHVMPKSFGRRNPKKNRQNYEPQKDDNNINNNNRYQNNSRINNVKSNDFIQNNYNKTPIIQNQEFPFNQSNINQNQNQFQSNNNSNYYMNNDRQKRLRISFNPITSEYSRNDPNNKIKTPINQINNNNINNNQNNQNININNDSLSTFNTTNNNITQNNNNIQGENSDEQIKEVIINSLNKLKNTLISCGSHYLFSFQRKLSLYDLNHQGLITFDNFSNIIQAYTMNLSPDEIKIIFDLFDKEKTGSINYNELMKTIVGQISPQRQSVVQKIFEHFNKDNNGKVSFNEIKLLFNSRRHPDVISGKKTEGEVFGEFLDVIESYREYLGNLRGMYDNSLSIEDFIEFYNEIGVGIEDDKKFEFMMYNCWNLDNNNMGNSGISNMGKNRYRNNAVYGNNNNKNQGNLMARAGSQIIQNNIF